MSFIRTIKRESPFVQLDKEFIGNGKLSLKATGLLTYILSKPDGWQIRMKDIQKRFTDGETAVRSAMKELLSEGYVNRYRDRGEDGKFGDWIYEVYERPEFNPKRENQVLEPKRDFPEQDNPEQGNPEQGNQGYSNNDFSNNDFSNNEEEKEENNYLAELISIFNQNICEVNPIIKNKIVEWLNDLPFEVIKQEFETCAMYGAKSWNYIESALKEDKNLGIYTVDQLEDKYNKFNQNKKKNAASYRKKPIRNEPVPDWLNKKNQGNENSENSKSNVSEDRKKAIWDEVKKLNG